MGLILKELKDKKKHRARDKQDLIPKLINKSNQTRIFQLTNNFNNKKINLPT